MNRFWWTAHTATSQTVHLLPTSWTPLTYSKDQVSGARKQIFVILQDYKSVLSTLGRFQDILLTIPEPSHNSQKYHGHVFSITCTFSILYEEYLCYFLYDIIWKKTSIFCERRPKNIKLPGVFFTADISYWILHTLGNTEKSSMLVVHSRH